MAHQEFDAVDVRQLEEDPDPVTFGLAGKTFRCLPQIPAMASAQMGSFTWTPTATATALRGLIVEEDEEAFDAVIADKKLIVTTRTLTDILQFVLASKVGRPLAPSGGSSNGHKKSKTSSTAS